MPSDVPADLPGLLRPGLRPTRVGPAWNLLGPGPVGLTALADWVVRRCRPLLAGDRSLDGCPVGPDEARRLFGSAPFAQVLNDLTQMTEGRLEPGPTQEFFGAARPADGGLTLDVGCSTGRQLWPLSLRLGGRQVGLDVDLLAMLAGDRAWPAGTPPPTWVRASALDMPFADRTFSHVFSAVTLSELSVKPALREMARVLRPGGQLRFTAEGPGFWLAAWDAAGWGLPRLQLLRWLAGNRLMELGVDWQASRLTRRLAGHTQFRPETLARLARAAGLEVDGWTALRTYRGRPSLTGLIARRPG